MRKNTVAKFGGTSLGTSSAIEQVVDIVKSNPEIRVVVLSASSGVTDQLVSFCHASLNARRDLIKKLSQIYLNLAKELGLQITEDIKHILKRLYGFCTQLSLHPSEQDDVLSLGEDLSSLLVCDLLKKKGISAVKIDARELIITDDHFGKASPHLSIIKERVQQIPSEVCVIQGFIGATLEHKTTTLGRGGSDYSASLIAEALRACQLLIYTDVRGVYTMDPHLLPQARFIEELSFQEMAEMANFGAHILHPATLKPCIRACIPVHILSAFHPHQKGTRISHSIPSHTDDIAHVRAITMRKSQTLVTIKSLKMLSAYGFLDTIFSILSKHKISVDVITTSEVSIALTIDQVNYAAHYQNPFFEKEVLRKELSQIAEIQIEEDLTLVAIVGQGLTTPGSIQGILNIVKSHQIRAICYGASESNVSILVPQVDELEIVEKLHQSLL